MDAISRAKAQAALADAQQAEELARIAALEKEQEQLDNPTTPADPPPAEPANPDAKDPNAPHDPPEPNKQEDAVEALKAELEQLRATNAQLENRWRTADGMLKKRDGDRDELLKSLQAKLDALEKRASEPPAKPPEKPWKKYLTPDEQMALGEDGMEPLELRAARGEIEATREELKREMDARLEAKLAEMRQQSESKAAEQARLAEAKYVEGKLFAKVDELVPGFKAEDSKASSNWGRFLDMVNPDTGTTYREMAQAMIEAAVERPVLVNASAESIAKLFTTYQAQDPSGSRKQALEGQVKPDASKASGKPPTPHAKPSHTMAEYNAFYTAKVRGKMPPNADGSPRTAEQIAALQAELDEWYFREQMAGR